jgi:hypothetical protein
MIRLTPKRRVRAARAAIAGTIAAGSLLAAGAAHAAYPGSGGRVAFVRNGNVYSIKADGTGLRTLATGGHDSGPRWSPQGTRIAYLDRGNLWIMNANGTGKLQVTASAPAIADSRPSWSPNGRYLAFVETARHAPTGRLVRYDTVTGGFVFFTTTVGPAGLIDVPALPAPVAWAKATNAAGAAGYFIVFEGAGALCRSGFYCLDALGLSTQSQYSNGFPSSEDTTQAPKQLTDPDWYPVNPAFAASILTTVESCSAAGCTHTGLSTSISGPTVLPGAYEGVYSPDGHSLAYVEDSGSTHRISTIPSNLAGPARLLATGTEPDWQPN